MYVHIDYLNSYNIFHDTQFARARYRLKVYRASALSSELKVYRAYTNRCLVAVFSFSASNSR